MKTESRTVRVFLSSTFRDFAEERDLLVRKVFPELRRKCRERQVELVDVDLRWGITEEEAQQGKVLPICLAEIDRSRPYFLGFIGERYGWVPKKHEYDESLTLEQTWLDELRGDKSVTELEMLHGVLNNPAMEDRAFFYFRDPDYSNSRGGAYLSESPEDKAKLEELKDRIRKSGFPVVENYTNPEALAEHVKQDLWKLIDDAFPESKVPDALDLERRRHEIYSASRQGMYIGGEKYFAALDQAMAEQPRKPVLVTGASGGGKSALAANWSQSFAMGHPNAVVLEHYLATGADSAEATGMVTRLLKEISRLTGEDLVLEGDPRKALHMFEQWLGKAGAFAQQQDREFVVVLDGLDKMTGGGGLDWWPRRLPDGVGLVVSCLPGSVYNTIAQRMDWDQIVVSPLGGDDCQAFIDRYLGKFRKPLPPELVELVLQHSLCGNPLFLRTLLEEMRVFGVHEQLKQRLNHYLASGTVDDLFERVLERIEADNRPDDVRAVLEVLWAAKESFAEDELLEISGLPPAVWAPIHIALDDSLIGEGGRLLFGHDYMRKAVEDRYLHSAKARGSIRKRMAEFCEHAMAVGRKDISLYVRRHAVEHFVEAEDWDNASAALSDLEFIEARSVAQELRAMLADYAEAIRLLPEGQKERQMEAARQAELDRYAKEMVEYAATWSRIRAGSGEAEPLMPLSAECVRLWTSEEIVTESKRMTETPSRLDIVKAFRVFVATNAAPLEKYSSHEGFVANLANNDAPAGPVHEKGRQGLGALNSIQLIRQFAPDHAYDPLAACAGVLEGHEDRVRCVSLSANGRLAASGGMDGTIRIWDPKNIQHIKTLRGHAGAVVSIALGGAADKLVSGSWDTSVRVWDTRSGACLKVLTGHDGRVTAVSCTPDGSWIVSGSVDKSLRIWDVQHGTCISRLEGHDRQVSSVVISNSGTHIISGDEKGVIRIWDASSGRCLKELFGHKGTVNCLALSSNGLIAVSGGQDGMVGLWDIGKMKCISLREGCSKYIQAVAISGCGRILVSGSWNGVIKVWATDTGECLKTLKGHEGGIYGLSLGADGEFALSAGEDCSVRIWNVNGGGQPYEPERHTYGVTQVALSSDGCKALSAGNDDLHRIWDARSGQCLGRPQEYQATAQSVFMRNGAPHRVSVGQDQIARIWNLETGESLAALRVNSEELGCVSMSIDGRRIFAAKKDGNIGVWDTSSGTCLRTLGGHVGAARVVLLRADGKLIASFDEWVGLRVWDSDTGDCLKTLEGHKNTIRSVAFSAEARLLVSGSDDGTIRVWDLEGGKCLRTLEAHANGVHSVDLTPDGKSILSIGRDDKVKIWHLDNGECFRIFEGHQDTIFSVSISPDGRWIASASNDGTIRMWDLHAAELRSIFFLRGLTAFDLEWRNRRLVAGHASGCVYSYSISNLAPRAASR